MNLLRRPSLDARVEFHTYTILEQLGKGGMGTAYRAADRVRGHEVVLKVPVPGYEEHFYAEAAIGLALNHPNCCRVLEVHAPEDDADLIFEMITSAVRSATPGIVHSSSRWRS